MLDSSLNDGFELATTRRTLPMALLRAREMVMERFRPLLHQNGVTEQQWRVLRVLFEADEMDASEIAHSACILAPSLSRMTKTLEARHFIEQRKDPVDARRTLIRLTGTGRDFIQRLAPESAAIYAAIEEKVGREGIETLLDGIDALLSALEEQG